MKPLPPRSPVWAAAPAITVARTPNGSVSVAPEVWPEGRPKSTGPAKPAITSATIERAVGWPSGSSHLGSSPKTTADARARMPLSRSCVSMRSIRNGRSPTSSRNSTNPVRWIEGVRRAERRRQLRQRSAEEHARRLARHDRFELRVNDLPCWFGAAQAPDERVAVVSGLAARQAAFDHRAMERDDAAVEREPDRGATCCRCSR